MEGADSQSLPRGLPAALGLRPGHAVPISERLGMALADDCVVYCLNIQAIDRHPRDDSEARNRCLARLARWRRATHRELAGAHGISARTVDRAVRRRSAIEDPGVLEKAGLLRRLGASLRAVAGKLGLCGETVRQYELAGLQAPAAPRRAWPGSRARASAVRKRPARCSGRCSSGPPA